MASHKSDQAGNTMNISSKHLTGELADELAV